MFSSCRLINQIPLILFSLCRRTETVTFGRVVDPSRTALQRGGTWGLPLVQRAPLTSEFRIIIIIVEKNASSTEVKAIDGIGSVHLQRDRDDATLHD